MTTVLWYIGAAAFLVAAIATALSEQWVFAAAFLALAAALFVFAVREQRKRSSRT
jgi:membrane protein implicated in regulation of membrane protease activity